MGFSFHARSQMIQLPYREVAKYFHNYAQTSDGKLAPGLVDRRPAVLVSDPHDSSRVAAYFVLLEWTGRRVAKIRDFRYARYAMEGAELFVSG